MNSPKNIDRSLNNLIFTENKILNYDYQKLMSDFKIKEKLKTKSQEKVISMNNDQYRKFQDFNNKWQDTMERMHENKNRIIEEKREKIAKKMNEKKSLNNDKTLSRSKSNLNTENYVKLSRIKDHSKQASNRINNHFNKIEMDRKLLNTKIYERRIIEFKIVNTFQEHNKDHLNQIREKFSQRISRSLELAKNKVASKENNIVSKLEELKVRPMKIYENWFVSYYTNNRKNNSDKKKQSLENKERIQDNMAYLENERELNNKKAMERIHKIEKNNLIQQENLRIRLEKSNNDFRERLNRVTEIKNIRRNKNNASFKKVLGKQFEAAVSANTLESLYSLKQSSIQEKKILNQIINQKKVLGFTKKLPKLYDSNITLKNPYQQKKAFLDLKQREEDERRRKEDELKELEEK